MILKWTLHPLLNLTREIWQGKKIDDVMLASRDVIVIFSVYSQSRAIKKPGSRRIIYKIYIFINSNLLSYKN